MNIYVSLLVAICGALLYGFATNRKAAEIGRLSFGIGLLVFLAKVVGTQMVNTFKW
jgi:Na+/phosphate symporter